LHNNLTTHVQIVGDFKIKLQLPQNLDNFVLTFKINIIESKLQCKKKSTQLGNFEKSYAPNKQQRLKV